MIDNFLSKPIIVPLWGFAALIGVLTWLVCRNTKTKWISQRQSKALDFMLALIASDGYCCRVFLPLNERAHYTMQPRSGLRSPLADARHAALALLDRDTGE